jgi:hypothetical protein
MSENEKSDDDSKITYWLREIATAKDRDKTFHATGQKVLDIYSSEDPAKVPFNILYSNTETLFPAIYSAVPRPSVRQRFKEDQDPSTQAAAHAATRLLEYLLDTGVDGYETFDEGMKNATLDALLPGRGVTLIKYDADINEDDDGEVYNKSSELVCIDSRVWNRVYFGYSNKWSKVPWVAFEEHIDEDEAKRLFKDKASKLTFLANDDVSEDDKEKRQDKEKQGGEKTACIYQIWDRDDKKVRYVSNQYKEDFLLVEDDPLQLTGFFPIPKPILFTQQSQSLDSIAPYVYYENQAKEINNLTRRINRLSSSIKAKGIYDGELGSDIENLLKGDDNTFTPADKSASLAAEKGFQNAIWFMPIAEMMQVLQNLYATREQCKQVIYEITGISDIIRGSTVASETATAQGIKSQWGTMRLKRMQGEVQRYARDMLRIMLEIAATKFSEKTWAEMTGLNFATTEQLQQAQMILQSYQMQAQQIPQMPGQPPQIPPQVQQAQQLMQGIQWPKVLEMLKNDRMRSYKIDIETNSTVLPEAVEDQKQIADVMTALGQYLQGVTPLIQSGAFPFEAAKAMMMAIVRRYQFGDEIEQYIESMKEPTPPQPPAPPPDNSMQLKQMDMQAKQAELQHAAQLDQAKTQRESVQFEMENRAKVAIEQGKTQAQIEFERWKVEYEANARLNEIKISSEIEKETEIARATIDANTKIEMARISAETESMRMQSESFRMQNEESKAMMDKEGKDGQLSQLIEAIKQPISIDLGGNNATL